MDIANAARVRGVTIVRVTKVYISVMREDEAEIVREEAQLAGAINGD